MGHYFLNTRYYFDVYNQNFLAILYNKSISKKYAQTSEVVHKIYLGDRNVWQGNSVSHIPVPAALILVPAAFFSVPAALIPVPAA